MDKLMDRSPMQITIGRMMAGTATLAVLLAWVGVSALLDLALALMALVGLGLIVAVPAAMAAPGRKIEVASWASLLQPVVISASIYVVWVAAWWALGREPRPVWDDPKNISLTVSFIHAISFVWVMFGSLLCFASGMWLSGLVFMRRLDPWPLLAHLVVWGMAYLALVSDPIGVVFWYMD